MTTAERKPSSKSITPTPLEPYQLAVSGIVLSHLARNRLGEVNTNLASYTEKEAIVGAVAATIEDLWPKKSSKGVIERKIISDLRRLKQNFKNKRAIIREICRNLKTEIPQEYS